MPNVHIACWTMSEVIFHGSTGGQRVGDLRSIALTADTYLKIQGRRGGGGFTRILVVPEYFFAAGGSISSRDDKHAIYRALEQISAEVPQLVMIAGTIAYKKGLIFKDTYNVCPVLYGGQIIKKLYKSNDDGVYQVNGSFKTKSDNGKGVPVVTVAGVTIGLDICMDFNHARLNTYLTDNGLGRPDIHIQISGTNTTGSLSAAAKVNGVYIHCDLGGRGVNGASAWRVTAQNGGMGATTARIQPTTTLTPPSGGRVMIFDTPV